MCPSFIHFRAARSLLSHHTSPIAWLGVFFLRAAHQINVWNKLWLAADKNAATDFALLKQRKTFPFLQTTQNWLSLSVNHFRRWRIITGFFRISSILPSWWILTLPTPSNAYPPKIFFCNTFPSWIVCWHLLSHDYHRNFKQTNERKLL